MATARLNMRQVTSCQPARLLVVNAGTGWTN